MLHENSMGSCSGMSMVGVQQMCEQLVTLISSDLCPLSFNVPTTPLHCPNVKEQESAR